MPFFVKLKDGNRDLIPLQHKAGDAGYDLKNAGDEVVIHPGKFKILNTGVSLEIPHGTCGMVCDRSGLASQYGVTVLGGIIDAGYRGEIRVILANLGEHPVTIRHLDRIAQLVFVRIETPVLMISNQLSESDRGVHGLGSSGGYASGPKT